MIQLLPVRLFIVFGISLLVATQINRAIYRLAWNPRHIGPWSPPHPDSPPRTARDRIPIFGWLGLNRESTVHGRGFWVRPCLLEIGFPLAMMALYIFEVEENGLMPLGFASPSTAILHTQFCSHFVLCSLMTVATFIDFDEKIIPDEITIPGTLIGMLFATFSPFSLLPTWDFGFAPNTQPLWLTSPSAWHASLNQTTGLVIGIASLAAWAYAVMPKTLWYRGGVVKFWRYLLASLTRHKVNRWVFVGFLVLSTLTTWVWWRGGLAWQGLLTSIIGMVGGGAVVWSIRLIAGVVMQREAMGFGDVTLLGMIGSFLGWQSAVVIFFLAPFTAIVLVLIIWLMTRHTEIAFGPYLCAGTIVLLIGWPSIWDRWGLVLASFGPQIALLFGVVLLLLAVSLLMVQGLKRMFFGTETP